MSASAPATIHVCNVCIVQAITRSMIYRTCCKCNGKLTVVFTNSSGKRAPNELYCKSCREFATALNEAYRMQITVVNLQDKSVENLIAFDAAIMPLIGCTASAFEALVAEHPDLYDIVETFLVGLNCDLDIRATPRVQKVGQQKPDRIVDAITPLSVPFVPAASSIMTCRYWQDNSMYDILEANTKSTRAEAYPREPDVT
ncbi:hypothetical protein Unana1_07950 [Umbelopsis nana]